MQVEIDLFKKYDLSLAGTTSEKIPDFVLIAIYDQSKKYEKDLSTINNNAIFQKRCSDIADYIKDRFNQYLTLYKYKLRDFQQYKKDLSKKNLSKCQILINEIDQKIKAVENSLVSFDQSKLKNVKDFIINLYGGLIKLTTSSLQNIKCNLIRLNIYSFFTNPDQKIEQFNKIAEKSCGTSYTINNGEPEILYVDITKTPSFLRERIFSEIGLFSEPKQSSNKKKYIIIFVIILVIVIFVIIGIVCIVHFTNFAKSINV